MGSDTSVGLMKGLTESLIKLPDREREREKWELEKKRREEELKRLQLNRQMLQRSMEAEPEPELLKKVQELELRNKLLNDTIGKQELWKAFEATEQDGNLDRLVKVIKNPINGPLYNEVLKLSYLNPDDPEDAKLMREQGLEPEQFKLDKNLNRIFWKAVYKNGEQDIIDSRAWKLRTGYYQEYKSKQEALEELERAKKLIQEADKKYLRAQIEKLRAQLVGAKSKGKGEGGFDSLKGLPYSERQARIATESEEKLKELFNVDSVYDIDFSKKENKDKARKYIRSIEKNTREVTNKDMEFFTEIAGLVKLGEKGTKIRPEDTGIIDDTLKKIGAYVFEDADKGTEYRAAWQAFSNSLIRAFAGAAMTDAEMARFKQEFGTLKQKAQPLLVKFKVALDKIKAEMAQRMDFYEPAVINYYVGSNKQKLDNIISALEERIEFISDLAEGGGKVLEDKFKKAKQKDLDEIFGFTENKENNKTEDLDSIFGVK